MANTVEVHVGSRLRRTREFRGVEQRDLARAMGLAVDDLDRLERGEARLAGPALFAAARALRIDPSFFFRGLKGVDGASAMAGLGGAKARPSRPNDSAHRVRELRSRPALTIVDAEGPRELRSAID